ncbi:MAG: response regulator transcription factor, partial [Verrucomicrobiota bacterium]|nr:response regulator transcription factor [Verrucomicrobiota bacterium]
ADDQKTVGLTLAALVERCGHEVIEVVSSGLDAIQAHTRLRPDIVLMDYNMPRLNGATACRMILSKDPTARIILVSGAPLSEAMRESGAAAILSKPVDLDRLYAALYDAGQQTTTAPNE